MQRRSLLALGVLCLSPTGLARAEESASLARIAVIVGPDSPLSDISLGRLRPIFLSHVREYRGRRVVPFNQPRGTLARSAFDQNVLGMNPEQSARYWVDQRIRGSSKPPRAIANPQLLLRVVSQFPGAIAYVRESDLNEAVKALTLSGRSLHDDDYPIRSRENDG